MIKKNVLLIAYQYPPFGQTSSRRSGCMAKYLQDFNWNPVVVTRDWTTENCSYDPSITSGIPENVPVYKVPCDVQYLSIADRIKKRLHQVLFQYQDPQEFYSATLPLLPDIIREHSIDIIWTTFPTLCAPALANQVSKDTGVPWVADFRDVTQFVHGFGAFLMYPIRIFWEKRVLKSAAAIVAVSDGFAATLKERHIREIEVVPNGFDPDILAPEESFSFPLFEVVYTGGLTVGRPDFTPLLDAFQHLVDNNKILVDDVRISFYGENNEKRLKLLSLHPFAHAITNFGGVSREESLKCQRSALILLQATSPGTGWMTSKIYEYLISRRPILAIPRDGDSVEKLLIETKAGAACTTKDEIANQLLSWYEEWKASGTVVWNGNMDTIMRYSRKEQAKDTAQVLEKVLLDKQIAGT